MVAWLTVASLVSKISLASSKSQTSSLHSRSNDAGFSSSMKVLALLERRSMCALGLLENTDQNTCRVKKAASASEIIGYIRLLSDCIRTLKIVKQMFFCKKTRSKKCTFVTIYKFWRDMISPDLQSAMSDQNTTNTEIQRKRLLIMTADPENTTGLKSSIIL